MSVLRRVAALVCAGAMAGVFHPPSVSSQTMIDVERLQPGDVVGWHASAGGALSLSGCHRCGRSRSDAEPCMIEEESCTFETS
jgi:hypothetical protein